METTTTDLRLPSSPMAFSRKSRTSLPRSPTNASTVKSAALPRAIMPTRVLFPTPLPPKIPSRWPRPQVRNPSIARTPQPSGSVMGMRSRGRGPVWRKGHRPHAAYSGPESMAWPVPSITRPSSSGPTRKLGFSPQLTMASPNCMVSGRPQRHGEDGRAAEAYNLSFAGHAVRSPRFRSTLPKRKMDPRIRQGGRWLLPPDPSTVWCCYPPRTGSRNRVVARRPSWQFGPLGE